MRRNSEADLPRAIASPIGLLMPAIPAPLRLLLATGALIGATFPLGKLAGAAGISPVGWSFLIAAGSAATLSIALARRAGGHRRENSQPFANDAGTGQFGA